MNNTRPVGVLRYNAEIMRDNGAPQDVIAKYLADNGSSFEQILAVPSPNENELERMLASEKDGTWAAGQAKFNNMTADADARKKNIERLAVAQGVARGFGNGLLFGAMDEIESGITGQPVNEVRNEQNAFSQKHPVLSIGSNIVGAVANPISRAIPVNPNAGLGAKVLSGAAQGLGYGGLYGFNEGTDGFENRLKNAGKMATTGAIVGGAIPVAVEGIKAAGRGIADVAGLTSGAGGESLKRAYSAGSRNSETFRNAMRGKSGVYDVVDDVDNAVRTLERNASAKYKAMLPDNGASLKLPDQEFKTALKKATESISGVTAGVDDTAANAINKVHKLSQNIKVSGGLTFDNALEAKKAIDGIIEPLARSGEKNAVRLLTPIKNALNETLEKAVPEYGGARAAFRADSKLIDSIKNALTSKDPTTELRKLQGITRQSVAAAQGGKQELGHVLDEISKGKILDAIAGGQVTQWVPRDPVRALAAGGTAMSTAALNANPLGVATLPAFSPRLSGELAYALGRASTRVPETNTAAVLRALEELKKRQ